MGLGLARPRAAFAGTLGLMLLLDVGRLPPRAAPGYEEPQALWQTDQTIEATLDSESSGQLAVFGPGHYLGLAADKQQASNTPSLELIVLGGRPIGEPVAWYGPFVMNTRAEVMQAMEDYRKGKLGVIPPNALMPHVVRD